MVVGAKGCKKVVTSMNHPLGQWQNSLKVKKFAGIYFKYFCPVHQIKITINLFLISHQKRIFTKNYYIKNDII